jgi:hypothetical protein
MCVCVCVFNIKSVQDVKEKSPSAWGMMDAIHINDAI